MVMHLTVFQGKEGRSLAQAVAQTSRFPLSLPAPPMDSAVHNRQTLLARFYNLKDPHLREQDQYRILTAAFHCLLEKCSVLS